METQLTFSDMEYGMRKRAGRREAFLRKMNALIPWAQLIALIEPHYYDGKRGRPPRGIETMLRMYLLQLWYNLSDEMTEESIYDSYAMKEFMKIDFHKESVPDATTLLGFRHLLEREGLQEKIFEGVNIELEDKGMIWRGGSVIDATIIEAPSSTKNSGKSRDPEMKQTKKGNEWHFGMKAHIGADAGTGMVHSVSFTPANVADIEEAHKLVRVDDDAAGGDAAYVGIEKRKEIIENDHLSKIDWRIGGRKGRARKRENALYKEVMKHLDYVSQPRWDAKIEYQKSKVRSKVEHNFYIVKRLFGYAKVRYRGIGKNGARLYMLFALANILRMSWRLNSLGVMPSTA